MCGVHVVGKIWWLGYRGPDGLRAKESSGSVRKGDAERLLLRRTGAREHNLPVIAHAEQLTFDAASQAMVDDFTANGKRSLAVVERRIKLHLKPVFGGRRMAAITAADVTSYIAARQKDVIITRKATETTPAVTKPVSNGEVNRELAILKRIFSLAIDAGRLASKPKIKMLQESPARSGFFEREQFDAVLAHLPAEVQPIVEFAYLTGWRVASEVLPLEWRNVDFVAGEIRIDPGASKNRDRASSR